MKFFFCGFFASLTQLSFIPSYALLVVMGFCMMLDFITGVYKSKRLGVARTSEGFRKTVDKFISYGVAICVSCVFVFMSEQKGGEALKLIAGFVNDGLVCFIIYIEITSVFENLVALDPNGMLSQNFCLPVLKFLTFQIKNNPVKKALEEKNPDQTIK